VLQKGGHVKGQGLILCTRGVTIVECTWSEKYDLYHNVMLLLEDEWFYAQLFLQMPSLLQTFFCFCQRIRVQATILFPSLLHDSTDLAGRTPPVVDPARGPASSPPSSTAAQIWRRWLFPAVPPRGLGTGLSLGSGMGSPVGSVFFLFF
jgi:hypothetical protein